MSDLRFCSRHFMTEFIALYRNYPCLWKTKSTEYKNRNIKDAAYAVLLKKLQEIEPNASKKTVVSKINSIRGSFRREMKKVEDSKRLGARTDQICKPHLWYYDLLLFTRDQEMPRKSVSNLDEDWESRSGSEQETDDGNEFIEQLEDEHDDVESVMSQPKRCVSRSSVSKENLINISSASTSSVRSKSLKRKRKTKVDEQSNVILAMLGEMLRNNTNNDDSFNIYGQHVAAKLRNLPKETRLYTEKLINHLLFHAEMGNIDQNTKIVSLNK